MHRTTMWRNGVYQSAYACITFLLTVCVIKSLKLANDFRFAECTWDGSTCSEIKEVKRTPDENVSEWPPGPYALPMPVDGCPESRLKGWEQGYIEFTWRYPYAVLARNISTSEKMNDDDTTVDLKDITLVQLTDIQSLIMGPYSRYRIKLNVCYKLRNDTTLDRGDWPDGSYGIYGDVAGCPTGFTVEDKLIKLPKTTFWISDGYLPYFQFNRTEEYEELRIRVCIHSMTWSVNSKNKTLPSMEPFVLLSGNKETPIQCSTDDEMVVSEVVLYLQSALPDLSNNTALLPLLAVCYYWPVKWSDDFNELTGWTGDILFREKEFAFTNVYISRGNMSADSYMFLSRSTETLHNTINDILAYSVVATTNIEWTIIDLGRTIPVTAVFVSYYTFPDESPKEAGRNCRKARKSYSNSLFCMTEFTKTVECKVFHWKKANEGFPRCFISYGKWDFLHNSALSCSYKVYYDFTRVPAGYYMQFNRIMEGRYVVLTEKSSIASVTERNVFGENVLIKVLTTDHILEYSVDNNLPCNSDMGMIDLNIDDFEISSSSSLPDFPTNFARPFLSGWCAEMNDTSPFIVVRFHTEVKLDGVTIWNWEGTYTTVINGTVQKEFFQMGTRSFKIAFGLTVNNLTEYSEFKLDLLYHVDEPQHFRFYRTVNAKIVKIHDIEPLFQNMRCLRFELHGCRKTGIKHLQCTKANDFKRYSGLFTPQPQYAYETQNKTLEECERACVDRQTCAVLNLYSNGDCVQFNTSGNNQSNQIWHVQEDVAGVTSAKICESEYIQTPYLIYKVSEERRVHDIPIIKNYTVATISVVNSESVISNIGYPLEYWYGESYKWVIQYREHEFIQFVFTNVSLNIYKHEENLWHCHDTIKFDEERHVFGAYIRKTAQSYTVDSSYNDRIFLIDSRVYQMTVTFTSCLYYTTVDHRGRGFRAVVQKQDVPTCFTVHDFNPVLDPHVEYCDRPDMYLTSLSYNNIPFHGFTEKWNIFHNTSTFRIDVLYFNVKCDTRVSEFILADRFTTARTFCTLNRPPGTIYTASGSVEITFFKGNPLSEESFRLIYRTVKDFSPETITVRASSIPDLIDSVRQEALKTKDNTLNHILVGYGLEQSLVRSIEIPRLLHKACSIHFNKCYMIYSQPYSWNMAGDECWIRHQRLVSIRSAEELKLIKYLLRTFKMTEQYPELFETSFVHNNTVYYYAYIGLRRYMNDKGKVHEMWENKTPVTYTAWKNGESLNGDCTRIGFYLANEDMTWEAVDCSKFMAFYTVCETDIGNRSIDIKDRVHVEEYKGMLNTTIKGLTCQRWDQQYPHQHMFIKDDFFSDESVQDAANYCRSPSGREQRLYCYTTDPDTEKDYCYVNELLEDISPVTYSGHLDVTWNGQKCLKWKRGVTFFDESLSEASNYCRVVYSTDYYTEEPGYLLCQVEVNGKEKNEACVFKDTASDRCAATHYSYAGIWNSTVSGADCIRWNMHLSHNNFDQYVFPDKDLVEAENYCRDPTSSGFQWCYTTFPGKLWEVCKVDYGHFLDDIFGNSVVKPMLVCKRGNNVLSYARCNGIVDCDDMSDELDCHTRLHPLIKTSASVSRVDHIPNVDSGSIFLCDSLEWISYLARCDGIIDCQDASDERNCTTTASAEEGCDKNQFMCGNGVCVHVSLVCNFVSDCADSSDEICDFPDCDEDEYTCASGQCIPSDQRCDAFEDCWDATDENDCQSCSSTEVFNCDFVRCLPRRLLCDGYPDCEDRSDESSCDMSDVTSCKEWWEAGYRETGEYIVSDGVMNGISVICDFTSVTSMGIIYTIFHQVDITEWEGETVFFTRFDEYNDSPFPYDDVFDFLFSADETANFTQQIVQSCAPPFDTASKLDDVSYNHTYIYCRCLNITIGIGWEPTINVIRDCVTGELLNENIRGHILFDYTYTANHRAISWKNADIPSESLRLEIGPVIFAEEFYWNASTFGCGEARNVFNISMQCVYDTDKAGIIIGCRSGSHLQNCKFHECREGTVKCPNSYCLPLRFVCDGVEQCPNAEDEYECGCVDTEREVIILHEDSDFRGPDVIKVARQLHSTNGIVRSVIYKSKEISEGIPFEHRILHIRDKEIKPFELIDRDYTCEYKVLANDYMGVVKFSKHTSRSLLFIQSSPESARVASLMFSNLTKMPDFNVYRIMEGVDSTTDSRFPNVKDVYVKNWNLVATLAARYMPEICKEASLTHCPGAYHCASSKMCVQFQDVCDGYRHCIHGDDEFLCDFICPSECVCNGLTVTCGESDFNITGVREFPRWTRSLELTNIYIDTQLSEDLFDFPFLYLLNLSRSGIERLEKKAFIKLSNLRILDVSNNKLTALSVNVFAGLQHLHTLILDGNRDISSLDPFTFEHLVAIRVLRITGTKLRTVKSNTFFGLSLEILDLRNNKIQEIEEFGLGNLAVNHIRFQGNNIQTFHKGVFTGVSSLISLQTPAYKFCCISPNYVSEDKCFPQKDEFSSCEDLMRISALQTMLWLIGLCAVLGNILSIIYRLIFDRQRLRLGYGIFVTNLAVADFLMGIYLMIIAVADAVFRKRYIFMDDYWRNSSWCTFAGVLSTVSSEASVMFLCLITIDRLLVIKYPFGQVRFDTKKALVISIAAWITSMFIALFPLMLTGYFQSRFYNKSGVCIALPLTRDRPPGWLYSVFVFIGLNFATFLLIAGGQWSIYREIRRSSNKLRKSQSRKKDLIVARNLLLVVATDFLCWFPIGCMGMMSMSGYVISGDVYAWAAVFILPVNSALNPLLYTLTAILGKKSFTPSTDEQARNTVHTGLGARFLVSQNIMRQRFYLIDCSTPVSYVTVHECLQTFDLVPFPIVLKMTHQLAECLLVLHKNALVLKRIDENSVYVKISQAMVLGDIQVRHEPSLCVKISDKREDVYHMGLLIKKLILKSFK